MNLTRKIYISQEDKDKGVLMIPDVNFKKVSYIIEDAAYWRKANAIHQWFVEHVQDGVDDCKEYFVSDDDLINLLKTVDTVLEHKEKAPELLPTKDGFFFGNTEYNEDYFSDLAYTRNVLRELAEHKKGTYYYQSSW